MDHLPHHRADLYHQGIVHAIETYLGPSCVRIFMHILSRLAYLMLLEWHGRQEDEKAGSSCGGGSTLTFTSDQVMRELEHWFAAPNRQRGKQATGPANSRRPSARGRPLTFATCKELWFDRTHARRLPFIRVISDDRLSDGTRTCAYEFSSRLCRDYLAASALLEVLKEHRCAEEKEKRRRAQRGASSLMRVRGPSLTTPLLWVPGGDNHVLLNEEEYDQTLRFVYQFKDATSLLYPNNLYSSRLCSMDAISRLVASQRLGPSLLRLDLAEADKITSLSVFTGLAHLKALNLQKCANLRGSLEAVSTCTSLEELSLSRTGISGSLDPLSKCSKLAQLDLSGTPSEPMKITGALTPLQACRRLEVLDLHCCGELTGSIRAIALCGGLQKLHLWDCVNVTGSIEALKNCMDLRIADLCFTQISGSLGVLEQATALEILDIRFTKNLKDVKLFKKQHPGCVVYVA